MRKILLTLLALLSLGVSGAWGLEIKFSSDEIKDSSRGGTNPATYYDASHNVVNTTTWCRSFTTNTSVPITFTAGSLDYFTNWYGGFNSNGSLWITASVPSQYVITSVSVKAKIIDGADKSKNMYFEGNTAGKVTLNSDYQTVSSGSLNSSSIRFRLEEGTNSECIIVFEDFTFTISTEVVDAAASINDGHKYRILTHNNGVTDDPSTTYYLTASGTLTDALASAGTFTFNATTSDQFVPAGYAWKINNGNNRFTNPNKGNRTNNIRTDTQNRDSYEAQVFYKNGSKYAVRAANVNDAEWHANAFWTVDADDDASGLPDADYALTLDEKHYVWELEDLSITYNLKFNGVTIASTIVDHTDALNTTAALPTSDWNNPYCTYSYSPSTITASTSVVNITMTWTGPFEISENFASAKWYVVDMHSNAGDKTWQYDSSDESVNTPVIAKNAYSSLSNNNLFCFVGDPYNGFKIYNFAAGDGKTLRKASTGNTKSVMSETDDHNLFKVYASTKNVLPGYCFKLDDDTYYLNEQGNTLMGWDDTDGGSACRFFSPNSYYIKYAEEDLLMGAPSGAVGTSVDAMAIQTVINGLKANRTGYDMSVEANRTSMNSQFATFAASEKTAITDGSYYRIINADSHLEQNRALVYNPTLQSPAIRDISSDIANKVVWSILDEQYVGNIFKLNESSTNYTIQNCNKMQSGDNQVYLSNATGAFSETLTAATISSLTKAQYNIAFGDNQLHAQGWNWTGDRGGETGNLVAYDGGLNSPSAWYFVPVTSISIPLNTVGTESYGTFYASFGLTLSGSSDVNAYIITIHNGRAKATSIGKNIPPATPVLLRSVSGAASVTATINDAATATTTGNKLVGTYTQLTSLPDGNNYILGNGDLGIGFYKLASGKVVAANKAYLNTDGVEVKSFALGFDEDGISSIGSLPTDNTIYDMSGRRVQNPARGLYIVNGKKVIVK